MGIKVSNLVMEYKKGVKSLDHVNLNIDHGIYGLLGENGAGKTTLMKILVTLLTPTSGTAEINGLTVEPKNFETIKKQIGYLPQEFGLYPNLTVRESLEYVGIMSGVQFMKSLQYHCNRRCLYFGRNAPLLCRRGGSDNHHRYRRHCYRRTVVPRQI